MAIARICIALAVILAPCRHTNERNAQPDSRELMAALVKGAAAL
jgi:hypothetical protein